MQTMMSASVGTRSRSAASLPMVVVAVTALLATVMAMQASAQEEAPADRGIDTACPIAAQLLDRFLDVESGPHLEAINCVAFYDITQGRSVTDDGRLYAPAGSVTRGQMATFLARLVELVTEQELPIDAAFPDDAVVHQRNIRKLATAEIVVGLPDGSYGPERPVTREQMASFVSRSLEWILGDDLPTGDAFPDVAGTHEASVRKLAAAGVVTGFDDGTYGPALPVTRAQMASFLARALDVVAERGSFPDLVQPVEGVPSTDAREGDGTTGMKAVTEVRAGAHDRFDRVTFEVTGEGEVGWEIDYVSEAREPGSGARIEVAGDAIIEVAITGVSLPPDLPDDIETWADDRLELPGENTIVEVVNSTVFEGRHTVFIGTTEVRPYVVQRLTDPQRVVIDVFRGFAPVEAPDIEPPPDPDPEPQVIASFTTPFVAAGQDRNTNIQLAADYIDGDVIPAGGSYSLNAGIGPRTSARGFIGNGFIDEDGEVISVIGGGVSQMGTTFLNAAWEAGIQLDAFRQHTIYFERYPMCREATLIWDVLDVLVTNDSPYDITISTSHTSTSVTVDLVSFPWADVDSWTGQPYDVVGGAGGAFSVDCGRTVTYPDGMTSSDDYSWRYDEGFPG